MGKGKENWREETKRVIRAYPALVRAENELFESKITASITGMPRSGSAKNVVEDIAMRTLQPEDQRALDAVRKAILTTGRYRNSKDRMRVIDLVYWKQTHDLHGAADQCHYGYDTVQEWNAAFIELVDAYLRIP